MIIGSFAPGGHPCKPQVILNPKLFSLCIIYCYRFAQVIYEIMDVLELGNTNYCGTGSSGTRPLEWLMLLYLMMSLQIFN